MKRIFFSLLFVNAVALCFAGDIVRVSAVYKYVSSNPNETPKEAQNTAIKRAKQQALEDQFGSDVSSVSSTFVKNRQEGKEVKSEVNVLSTGEIAVRGEWIETTKEQVLEKKFENGFWIIKVRVEGLARKNSAEKVDIQCKFIRDVNDVESPVTFRDGNDIFLRFSSPVAGSLCVYLVDEEQNAYCLLPYMNNQLGYQSVEANKEYIFFSSKYDKDAQEYTLNCERSSEHNIMYVIFSPNKFTKVADNQAGKNFRDEQLPRELSYEDLQKWLSRSQMKDPEMVVRTIPITIQK